MQKTSRRFRPVSFVVPAAVALATLSIVAQSPQTGSAPPPQSTTPQQQPPAGAPPGDPAARDRQGFGRGTPMWEPDFTKKAPVPVLTPAEQQKRFWLPPGYKLEPVLADPDIMEPAQIAFDGNGRMWVLEILGYMQDADANGELDPV